jgi:hypothetical protein
MEAEMNLPKFNPNGHTNWIEASTRNDPVNRPAHYTQGKVECIDAIESALGPEGFIAFLRGQVIKYNWRLPHKGAAAQDAGKAKFYQDLLADRLRGADRVKCSELK